MLDMIHGLIFAPASLGKTAIIMVLLTPLAVLTLYLVVQLWMLLRH